ncbi:MAG: Fpg/Nei family DNA glycosylase [Actinotalea sp.]|nr:Fpg/Nei family DNA glycosylase [Actinotalea sp.]
MPEGHTVHRIALQFDADMVGRHVTVSSPQGRFADGAALLDGLPMVASRAQGKHLFLAFGDGTDEVLGVAAARWLRVHLGLYGAWDFHGTVSPIADAAVAAASLGAPRVRRARRMGEGERDVPDGPADDDAPWPPEPVGQVRVRLATEATVADLRGPTACTVVTPEEVRTVVTAAGPDPRTAGADGEAELVRRLTSRRVAVGQLLMDQSVVSGIGNIYRAEMLFRAELDPFTPGVRVPAETARALWQDWVALLEDGVRTGVMVTRADLSADERGRATRTPALRHAVYGRAGEPCLRCGTPIALAEMAGRKLYWCPGCQR